VPDFTIENKYKDKHVIVGIDEAGRGPLAGPVVAGAVVFPQLKIAESLANSLDDSKKLKPKKREELYEALFASDALIGVGMASAAEIDKVNILQATFLAMRRALDNIGIKADLALVDGNRDPKLYCPAITVIKGDGLSLSIAAASIVAKVTRDRIMTKLALQYPPYGWDKNAAYGTKEHLEALAKYGPTPEHRRSFAPVKKYISPFKETSELNLLLESER
jgi:ribonuclease HII